MWFILVGQISIYAQLNQAPITFICCTTHHYCITLWGYTVLTAFLLWSYMYDHVWRSGKARQNSGYTVLSVFLLWLYMYDHVWRSGKAHQNSVGCSRFKSGLCVMRVACARWFAGSKPFGCFGTALLYSLFCKMELYKLFVAHNEYKLTGVAM